MKFKNILIAAALFLSPLAVFGQPPSVVSMENNLEQLDNYRSKNKGKMHKYDVRNPAIPNINQPVVLPLEDANERIDWVASCEVLDYEYGYYEVNVPFDDIDDLLDGYEPARITCAIVPNRGNVYKKREWY